MRTLGERLLKLLRLETRGVKSFGVEAFGVEILGVEAFGLGERLLEVFERLELI